MHNGLFQMKFAPFVMEGMFKWDISSFKWIPAVVFTPILEPSRGGGIAEIIWNSTIILNFDSWYLRCWPLQYIIGLCSNSCLGKLLQDIRQIWRDVYLLGTVHRGIIADARHTHLMDGLLSRCLVTIKCCFSYS